MNVLPGCIAPGRQSWREEVKRLTYHVPNVCCETFHVHSDEVLDVAFSHNGKYFCTSSKDALAIVSKYYGAVTLGFSLFFSINKVTLNK